MKKFYTGFLVLSFLTALCNGLSAQSIQGSFESEFKRYIKQEQFSGPPTLSDRLTGWKGERLYSQLVVWSATDQGNLTYDVSDLIGGSGTIPASNLQLMFAKNVLSDPDARSCGTYPRPRLQLAEVADALSFNPVGTIQAGDPLKVWVRVNIPAGTAVGSYSGMIKVRQNGGEVLSFDLTVEVLDKVLPGVSQWQFHLDLWQYPYALLDHYNAAHPGNEVEPWSNTHLQMIRPYYELLADAGQKVITAHIKDGAQGQPSMIKWIRKTDGTWTYDFTDFDKFVNMMTSLGISKQINCFSPAGWDEVKQFIPFYDEATNTNQNLPAPLASTEFNVRWNHFLTAFKAHLVSNGWFDKAVLYLDEIEEVLLQDIIDMVHANDPNWKLGLTYFHPASPSIDSAMYDLSGILGESVEGNRGDKISTF